MDQHIDAYQPLQAGSAWLRVADEVRRVVKAAEPASTQIATSLLGPLARLALFADARGLPADAEVWLSRELIEQFIATGCPTAGEATRGNYRCRLLNLRRALVGPELVTGDPARFSGARASKPYTAAEMTLLWSWASGQPTADLRRSCKILLALGRGCGLDSPEVVPLRSHDVRVPSGDAPVVVNVRGPRSRLVICRRSWGPILADLTAESHDIPAAATWLFRPEAHTRGKNTVTNFLSRTKPAPGTPNLSMGRLRSTFLVDLIDEGVRLPTILAAAGVSSLHALSRLLPYVADIDPDLAAEQLWGRK